MERTIEELVATVKWSVSEERREIALNELVRRGYGLPVQDQKSDSGRTEGSQENDEILRPERGSTDLGGEG